MKDEEMLKGEILMIANQRGYLTPCGFLDENYGGPLRNALRELRAAGAIHLALDQGYSCETWIVAKPGRS